MSPKKNAENSDFAVSTTALSFDPHLYKILNQAACSMKNSGRKESHVNLS
jgi:hypothetical protein